MSVTDPIPMPLDFKCGACGAEAGDPCVRIKGRYAGTKAKKLHSARYNAVYVEAFKDTRKKERQEAYNRQAERLKAEKLALLMKTDMKEVKEFLADYLELQLEGGEYISAGPRCSGYFAPRIVKLVLAGEEISRILL